MKRPYEDPDSDAGEKSSFKDWDRPSSHRRFYSKPETPRKGSFSSSYDRSMDDDRESSRYLRKRFEPDPDAFDRRRYRDVDRADKLASSPRGVSYGGGDRLHRSQSFSGMRREFPKGFRSERDRSRRDASSGSSWKRSDELRSPSVTSDSGGKGNNASSEDRGKSKARDSPGGVQSRRDEAVKADSPGGVQLRRDEADSRDEGRKGSCGSSSEMEEGELEPEPDPEPDPVAEPSTHSKHVAEFKSEVCKRGYTDGDSGSNKGISRNELGVKDEGACNQREEERVLPIAVDQDVRSDKLQDRQDDTVDVSSGEEEEDVKIDLAGNKQKNLTEETLSLPIRGAELKSHQGEEQAVDEAEGICYSTSHPRMALELEAEPGGLFVGADVKVTKRDDTANDTQPKYNQKVTKRGDAAKDIQPKYNEVTKREDTSKDIQPNRKEKVTKKEDTAKDIQPKHNEKVTKREDTAKDIQPKHNEKVTNREDTTKDIQPKHIERRGFNLEVEPEGVTTFLNLCKKEALETTHEEDPKVKEVHKDKGKIPAISLSDKTISTEDDNAMEGTSGRGFELAFRSEVNPPEQMSYGGGLGTRSQRDKESKLEPLDLSLSLPGNHTSDNLNVKHSSPPSRARSIQSLPSSFRTISDGFTTSISFSNSQAFSHNPSCSLTHNSADNYEHSVGSHPIFKGVWQAQTSNETKRNGGGGSLFKGEQLFSGTVWQGQTSNEPKRNGGGEGLFHQSMLNGNPSHSSLDALKGQHQSNPDGLSRQSSLPRQVSPAQSHDSRETWPENSKDKRLLTKARSSSSLFRSEQKEGEVVLTGVGVVERILSKIVTEPLQVTSKMLHAMTEPSVAYLKETVIELVANRNKRGHVHALQEALNRRSDLTVGAMSNCTRVLLEILVALKTGLPDFLRKNDNVPSTDLVEIFLNLKCRNLECRSILPVDECDCRVCIQKNGFCRECMCLVCSKFDMASNTCSWVGCDLCLHWCHTDCGLRESHIRNGRGSSSGIQGTTEMQFHCVACNHPSEMFGFVKEVFKTCSRLWKVETLAKELQYVRQIFSASKDSRGKKMCEMADQMLLKLEDKSNLSEAISYIMAFLSEDESNNSRITPSTFAPKDPSINAEASNSIACPKKDSSWLPSVSAEKVSHIENIAVLSSMNDRIGRQARDAELQANLEKKPVIDELDSVVRLKQAEAKMYQERADDARRESEGLKRIAAAKDAKIEEDYTARIAKLRLSESQERRRQKLEELQVIERAQREYFNMKVRMEADIKDLLLKMEATKRNFST